MTSDVEQVQATKRCNKCAIEKSLECFSKTKRNKDGFQRECKSCVSDYKRQNREHIAVTQQAWRLANLEEQREYDRNYYSKNATRKREYHRNRYFQEKSNEEAYKKKLERARVLNRMSQRRYPERQKARKAVIMAIKCGKLSRPNTCSKCSVACKPEAHHDSYDEDKRIDVRWLCKQCHEAHHRKHPDTIK